MKYVPLFALLFFAVVSCNKAKEPLHPVSAANRQNIQKWFNQAKRDKQTDTEAINAIALKMEKATANEPAEYKAMATIAKGVYYSATSSYELATKSYEKAIVLLKKSTADSLKAFAYTGIGNSAKNTADYPKAFENFYKALKIFENSNHADGISMVNSFIGETHIQKNDFASAEENLKIAIKTLQHDKGKTGYLNAAHTLANVYGMAGNFKKALEIDEEGIRISDSIHSPNAKSTFLDNKANCFMYSNRLDSAKFYFDQCLKIDLASGNKKQIADTYSNLGQLAAFQNDFKTAEAMTLKSIALLKMINNKYNINKAYQILEDVYTRHGDYKKALETNKLMHEEYRKMISAKKEASLAEFKILHETEKKEKMLNENKIELLQKNAEVRQRNNLLIVLSLLVFFMAMIGLLIYRQQQLKNRQQLQEHELKTAISQIETQHKLQNQRLEISRDLHDNIGAQLTFIISSVDNIKYAFDLKDTKLDAKLQNISTFARETIVELRDTIWAMNNNKITFEDLKIRILNFIEKAKEAKETIGFGFSIAEELAGIRLTSIVGMNIYRTIQEAINNALKYANGTKISIEIKPQQNNIQISITDNGVGFDPENTARGNGLYNMEKRIADIGGTIVFQSGVNKGTNVSIVFPRNLAAQP